MTRLLQFAGALAIAVMALSPVARAADPSDVIDYRQHAMKSLAEQLASLNMTLQGKAPAENMVLHAQTLAVVASTALKAFEDKVPGGEAKPDVWAKWDDFSKKMNELAANTAELAKVAQSGGAAAVQEKLKAGAMTCKGCHDVYREDTK